MASETSPTPGTTPLAPLPVSSLSEILKEVIAESFPSLWIQGEITGLSKHKNGHYYFTLRDQEASLRSVIWASSYSKLRTPPKEGSQVVVLGRLGLYPARGDLQLSISQVLPVGTGSWQKQFEDTMNALSADGLLDPSRRRPLPVLPRTVAVITSATGAAWQDVLSVSRRRFPGLNLILIPATVQGAESVSSLLNAFKQLYDLVENPHSEFYQISAAILTRGGGSREDLWAFNDESVARAVASCPVPIVAAIGHEIDITICELVADLRAATPSAAAENLVPEISSWYEKLEAARDGLKMFIETKILSSKNLLSQREVEIKNTFSRIISVHANGLSSLAAQLDALSPLSTLRRGYVLATDPNEKPIIAASQIAPGAQISLTWSDGTHKAEIIL